ncbi:MAG: methyl-accepting chemotaxis protein [Euryarchaeota archaeon]|nr:methyl-accepting chemotaxis protein [Euryarchaeota archaeon]
MVDIIRRPARSAVFGNTTATPAAEGRPRVTPPVPGASGAENPLANVFAEQAPRPILAVDSSKNVSYANPWFRTQFNSGQDCVGRAIQDWLRDAPAFLDSLPATGSDRTRTDIRGQPVEIFAFRVKDAGNAAWMLVLGEPHSTMTTEVRARTARIAPAAQTLATMGETLSATTEEISAAIQQVAKGAQDQAQRVEETVRAVKTLADEIHSISEAVKRAQDASAAATTDAKAGQEAARQAIEKMATVRQSVEESMNVVRKLGDRSTQIQNIVGSITNIAQQTNLLALNAAIEAARAGEHGRGFAVVAEEVRKLADSSRKAADQIVSLTGQISADIDQVVDTMGARTKDVADSSVIVSTSLKSLGEIAEAIEATNHIIEEISRATETQRIGAETIVKSVDEVAVIAEETSSSTEETSASIEEFTSSMEELAVIAQELAQTSKELQRLLDTGSPFEQRS